MALTQKRFGFCVCWGWNCCFETGFFFSLCSPGCPATCSVDQAVLLLTEICLTLPMPHVAKKPPFPIYFYLMCMMSVLSECVCKPPVCLASEEAKEGVRSLGTEITVSCELPFECWKFIPDPLEEQPMLLTAELSFQCTNCLFTNIFYWAGDLPQLLEDLVNIRKAQGLIAAPINQVW